MFASSWHRYPSLVFTENAFIICVFDCRHGKEDRLVTLFGLMQALVSFVADCDDVIRCIISGNHKFVFLVKSPLILVAVSHTVASVPQLIMQLT